jgi:hypothetical protein
MAHLPNRAALTATPQGKQTATQAVFTYRLFKGNAVFEC